MVFRLQGPISKRLADLRKIPSQRRRLLVYETGRIRTQRSLARGRRLAAQVAAPSACVPSTSLIPGLAGAAIGGRHRLPRRGASTGRGQAPTTTSVAGIRSEVMSVVGPHSAAGSSLVQPAAAAGAFPAEPEAKPWRR